MFKVAHDEYREVGHHRDGFLERHFSLARRGRVRDCGGLGHVGQRDVAVAGGPHEGRVEGRLSDTYCQIMKRHIAFVRSRTHLKRGFVETGEGPPRVRRLELGSGDGSRPSVGVHVCGLVEPEYAVLRQRA